MPTEYSGSGAHEHWQCRKVTRTLRPELGGLHKFSLADLKFVGLEDKVKASSWINISGKRWWVWKKRRKKVKLDYAAEQWIETPKVYLSSSLCLELTRNSAQCHLTLGCGRMRHHHLEEGWSLGQEERRVPCRQWNALAQKWQAFLLFTIQRPQLITWPHPSTRTAGHVNHPRPSTEFV